MTTTSARTAADLTGRVIVISLDDEYNQNPGDFVGMGDAEDAEYVARFERGELTAYIVAVVEDRYDGAVLGSLSGVDVETANAEGVYRSLTDIDDDYLREVAIDVLTEAD